MEPKRIRNLSGFMRSRFGRRVHKVGLWGGFDCPNRDGTFSREGCSFCDPRSSMPGTYRRGMSIGEQLEEGCSYISKRYKVDAFLPYFQDYTTTYGDPIQLAKLYYGVLDHPGVVGLSLCTRPDCLGEEVLDLLEEIAVNHFLWVELGVQTSDDEVLMHMNRCHSAEDSMRAFELLHGRGITTAAHMILGYPGQDAGTVLKDAAFILESGTSGIKLQNFHVVKGTRMEEGYRAGDFTIFSMEDYVNQVILFLEHTHSDTVVLRLSGEAPKSLTAGPPWSLNKAETLRTIHLEMDRRDSWQGKALGLPRESLDVPLQITGNTFRGN